MRQVYNESIWCPRSLTTSKFHLEKLQRVLGSGELKSGLNQVSLLKWVEMGEGSVWVSRFLLWMRVER